MQPLYKREERYGFIFFLRNETIFAAEYASRRFYVGSKVYVYLNVYGIPPGSTGFINAIHWPYEKSRTTDILEVSINRITYRFKLSEVYLQTEVKKV